MSDSYLGANSNPYPQLSAFALAITSGCASIHTRGSDANGPSAILAHAMGFSQRFPDSATRSDTEPRREDSVYEITAGKKCQNMPRNALLIDPLSGLFLCRRGPVARSSRTIVQTEMIE